MVFEFAEWAAAGAEAIAGAAGWAGAGEASAAEMADPIATAYPGGQRVDLGGGSYFQFEASGQGSALAQRMFFEQVHNKARQVAAAANDMAGPEFRERMEGGQLYGAFPADDGSYVVAPLDHAIGELDDAHNDTLAKAMMSAGDVAGDDPMTFAEEAEMESQAAWANDEIVDEGKSRRFANSSASAQSIDDLAADEEEVQQRDRPVRLKRTRDPGWRNKGPGR